MLSASGEVVMWVRASVGRNPCQARNRDFHITIVVVQHHCQHIQWTTVARRRHSERERGRNMSKERVRRVYVRLERFNDPRAHSDDSVNRARLSYTLDRFG
jgi:hypothetical protein